LPSGYTERLSTLTIFTENDQTVHSEDSLRGRTSEILTGVNMFLDHPILGVGVNNYVVHYQDYASRLGLEYRSQDRQAHSLYVEVAAETGIVGLVVAGGIFLSLFYSLTQASNKLKVLPDVDSWKTWISSLQIGLAAYLTTSIFLHGDYIRYLWLIVALSIAMIHLADYLVNSPQPLEQTQ
jgi:O-antigen ligase